MTLQETIKRNAIEALKDKDELRTTLLRGLSAAFVNELVATSRKPDESLPDEEAVAVMQREAKKRREAFEQYKAGGREDLAQREEKERAIIEEYLPQQMSREEIQAVVERKQAELGINDTTQMGALMGPVMAELKGKADGALVREVVEKLLH